METKEYYEYKDIPLSPTILSNIIVKLFNGRLAETSTLIEESENYHIKMGGRKYDAKNHKSLTKQTIQSLKKKGVAESPTRGYLKISAESEEKATDESFARSKQQGENDTELLEIPESEKMQTADKIIGTGKRTVYLYYLPTYKHVAEQKNEVYWQCKIGKSDGEPLQRILQQASTALPEIPHFALQIYTDLSHELEKSIHHILTLRGRKIANLPGQEWFLTSPDEIISIYNFIIENKSAADADLQSVPK